MASKDSHDPGWNDPPIFTYDKATAIQAATSKKGILLNKRVAFPISGSLGNQNVQSNSSLFDDLSKPPISQLPPISALHNMNSEELTFPSLISEQSPKTSDKLASKVRLDNTLKNLRAEANCDEEITKRINVMEKMWTDGKLEEEVQCRICDLSESLLKGEIEAVDHIQKGLMVDYVSQCSSWMSGIRRLINQKRDKNRAVLYDSLC